MNEVINGDDQIVKIILLAISLLVLMSIAIIAFFYYSSKRIIKSEREKASLEVEHQKEMLRATIITQEEERKRIAQDLHDAISSKLNIVSLNANMLIEKEIPSKETNKIGASILAVTTTVLESSRQIAHDLLPATLEKFGLQAALEELCEELMESGRFQLNYSLNYTQGTLKADRELHLFRIAQELVSNTIKHSEATSIHLTLETSQNLVSLHYSDNGKGFDPNDLNSAKGLGMSGIANRVAILNGKSTIHSAPGSGIEVSIDLSA
jgi:signal transduction histidine kinase